MRSVGFDSHAPQQIPSRIGRDQRVVLPVLRGRLDRLEADLQACVNWIGDLAFWPGKADSVPPWCQTLLLPQYQLGTAMN